MKVMMLIMIMMIITDGDNKDSVLTIATNKSF